MDASASGRFCDRFQKVLDKLLKAPGLDVDVKSWLNALLVKVRAKAPEYDSAPNFWEDIKGLFEQALKTRASADATKRIKTLQGGLLENLQVQIFSTYF